MCYMYNVLTYMCKYIYLRERYVPACISLLYSKYMYMYMNRLFTDCNKTLFFHRLLIFTTVQTIKGCILPSHITRCFWYLNCEKPAVKSIQSCSYCTD